MKNLRQKLYDKVNKLGVLGDVLNTEVTPKGLAYLTMSGIIAGSIAGCGTTRSLLESGQNRIASTVASRLEDNFAIATVNQNNSQYKAKGVTILGDNYYVLQTGLGTAMFRDDKAIRENVYEVYDQKAKNIFGNETAKIETIIEGKSNIQSGEGGLYFIEKATRIEKGKKINLSEVSINMNTQKAKIKSPYMIKSKGDVGIFSTTEQDVIWELNPITIPTHGLCYPIRVEPTKRDADESEFYNFYLVPVNSSKVRTNKSGKIQIKNADNVNRPTLKKWDVIEAELKNKTLEEKAINLENKLVIGTTAIESK